MVVLPGSVSTSRHSARDSVAAMRSAGKCGSMGRYTPPGLEDGEDRSHPVQVAFGHHRDDPSGRSPRASRARAELVGPRVELPVGPLPVAVHGRDGVRVRPHPLLEQLVDPAVRQLPARSGEPFELEPELLGGEQALGSVISLRIGGDQG